MKFSEVVAQTLAWLEREGRVSYRALKLEFDLNDDVIDALKEEIIDAKRLAIDENGKVLVWTGTGSLASSVQSLESQEQRRDPLVQTLDARPRTLDAAAERRQLTVMFCDLVGSTALSTQLDPEELREVVRSYQHTCGEIIARYEGHIAQHLGDGLLVYFGYPQAHEDDARRAVRAGLEILAAFREQVPSPLAGEGQGEGAMGKKRTLQVRLGIHTGLVVIGEMGTSGRTEQLALGETPNVAARIQGLAEPNTMLISAATQRLVTSQFECQPFGSHLVKGIETPLAVYHVQSERQHAAPSTGHTTPLVGREQEVGLLRERWEQVKDGRGQVVLLTGEPGIGKSRLTQTLTEHVTTEGALALEALCSPYHQNSAFYPLIDAMQRTLFTREDSTDTKVGKLERTLALYDMQDILPRFAALLSLPLPVTTPPLNLTPQKQKERTIQAMVQWWLTQAERQATVSVWEDLHWADPSTLEFLTLLLEQVPTSRLLVLFTARPEFVSPWSPRSHLATLTLNRLGRRQTETMIATVAGASALPTEVRQQILAKTDGVPLFVEELTKSVIETTQAHGGAPLQALAIPATLQDSLMARLDRLNTAKEIAQLSATLGREFSYELLQAISPLTEDTLQQGLRQLVESELVYQRGTPPQAQYTFKHALIQDAAYQSLLKSRRQQLHQQIALVLEERFVEITETQPELVAYHYTEANLIEQAIPYWQQAGEKAVARSANEEAISHLTKGLELLKPFPETQKRDQQELVLQIALGVPLRATKGLAASEVGKAYTRARELSQRTGEPSQLFPVLRGLWEFHELQGELQLAREIGEQLLTLAQHAQDPALLLVAHDVLGDTLVWLGEFATAREHLEQGITLYDAQQHRSLAFLYGYDSGVACLSFVASTLWYLGYPDQALKRSEESLILAQELSYPHSMVFSLCFAADLHPLRREARAAQERAEAAITLSIEQGFPFWLAWGTMVQGWALAEQGQGEEGIAQIRQGLAAYRATGAELERPRWLALLAETYRQVGQIDEGLTVLAEALSMVHKNGEHQYEAELYRLKGELLLAQADKR